MNHAFFQPMRSFLRAIRVAVCLLGPAAAAAKADLPNANLPGNSPSLPNSNLPGSMPTDNPITLPSSETSRAVVQPGQERLYEPDSKPPSRNPTAPPSPDEQATVLSERAQLADELASLR